MGALSFTCSFAERHKFHSAVQNMGESLSEWAARVRDWVLSERSVTGNAARPETLRDRFVLGLAGGPQHDRVLANPRMSSRPNERSVGGERALRPEGDRLPTCYL